jgi:hypothetical protein
MEYGIPSPPSGSRGIKIDIKMLLLFFDIYKRSVT